MHSIDAKDSSSSASCNIALAAPLAARISFSFRSAHGWSHTLEQYSCGAHMRLRTIGKALVLTTAVSSIAAFILAQESGQKPSFEAATIKRMASNTHRRFLSRYGQHGLWDRLF